MSAEVELLTLAQAWARARYAPPANRPAEDPRLDAARRRLPAVFDRLYLAALAAVEADRQARGFDSTLSPAMDHLAEVLEQTRQYVADADGGDDCERS